MLPYTSKLDTRLTTLLKKEILKFFQDWHKDAQNREGTYTKDERERMMITSESYESLHITIHGFCGAVEYMLGLGAPSIDAKSSTKTKWNNILEF